MRKLLFIISTAMCVGFAMSCAPNMARIGDGGAPAQESPALSEIKEAKVKPKAKPEKEKKQKKKKYDGAQSELTVEVEQLAFAKPDAVTFEYERLYPESVAPPVRPDDFFPPGEMAPTPGGAARIYLQRGFMDDIISDMVRLNPFDGAVGGLDDGEDGAGVQKVFKVTDSTHRRLELTLTGDIRRANGRRATALDFIELWSRFMKARPAQGLALFRNVQGAEGYVTGKDPLVGGFNAADENTIRIRFDKPDPLAFARLNSTRLIGGPFMLGSYYTGAVKGAEYLLLPNANSLSGDRAFLRECVVVTGGDTDPIKSFATGKYDAMTLYKAYDLQIARTELADDRATLHKLPSDRYFLSCKAEDDNVRKFIRRSVNGADLLTSVISAEGEEIGSVAAQSETVEFPRGHIVVPQLSKPLRFIYRSDDPISVTVAEKISADLIAMGMAVEAAGHPADKYESALVRGQYDCALGWVPETVLENQTEQLHLASMWFADELDNASRVREYKEIPLFSVNNYLLLREDVRLFQDKLTGLWVDVSQGGGMDGDE